MHESSSFPHTKLLVAHRRLHTYYPGLEHHLDGSILHCRLPLATKLTCPACTVPASRHHRSSAMPVWVVPPCARTPAFWVLACTSLSAPPAACTTCCAAAACAPTTSRCVALVHAPGLTPPLSNLNVHGVVEQPRVESLADLLCQLGLGNRPALATNSTLDMLLPWMHSPCMLLTFHSAVPVRRCLFWTRPMRCSAAVSRTRFTTSSSCCPPRSRCDSVLLRCSAATQACGEAAAAAAQQPGAVMRQAAAAIRSRKAEAAGSAATCGGTGGTGAMLGWGLAAAACARRR